MLPYIVHIHLVLFPGSNFKGLNLIKLGSSWSELVLLHWHELTEFNLLRTVRLFLILLTFIISSIGYCKPVYIVQTNNA